MHLRTLTLKNFRNFISQKFQFNPEFNFIFGKNAQGKTNIMEAIFYLSELKSFRTSNRHDLITNEADFTKIEASFEKQELNWDILITLSSTERKVLLNNKKPQSRQEYYELIPLILFEPRHIYLFRDSPAQRRQYLNRALYVQDVGFLRLMRDYDKVVSQKNRVLKDSFDLSLLDVWNEKLIELGSQIIFLRLKWFHEIKEYLAVEYKALSQGPERFHLGYKPARDLLTDYANPAQLLPQELKEILGAKVADKRNDEINRRETLVGPHRDDFHAFLDDRHLGQYGSQGENRSAVIALKLAQLKMYAHKFQRTPLFLLDDVASELDEDRCQYLFSYLQNESTQVFLTTTENNVRGANFKGHATSFLVERGQVSVISWMENSYQN